MSRLSELPSSLRAWREIKAKDESVIWDALNSILCRMGYEIWPQINDTVSGQHTPGWKDVFPNGYSYATSSRGLTSETLVGTVGDLREMWILNGLSRMFRSQEGYDNLIRVMAVKDDGREELRILRFLATAPQVLLSENHTIPLLREIDIEDLTLGVFPRVSQPLDDVYTNWSKNSVGDVLDMILQALEGLALIHKNRIAHRDAFKENFVVEYFPESLRTGVVPVHKPRVYLIDFETAVQFPEDCPPAERVCTGIPFPEYVVDPKRYKRPTIPEMRNGEPYDPFKLDVWQLGNSLVDFNSTLPPVEAVIDSMAHMDPSERLTADEALSRIRAYVESVPPRSLLIPPKVEEMP